MITKEQEEKLIKLAAEARENAYCPYSGYKVGASVLTSRGNFYTGCNVENAAYSTSSHGEVNAINTAVGAGEREFLALAVITENDHPPFPCCICRQTMAEFDNGNMEVIAASTKGTIRKTSFSRLYPEPFGSKQLGINPKNF